LLENYKCSLQIGGNDQTGNITTGYDLISKVRPNDSDKVFGLTLPIITTENGDKLGKSARNCIWLNNDMLSPFEFFQFFLNTADSMVENYLKIFTFIPLSEIDDLMAKHKVLLFFLLFFKLFFSNFKEFI
jgi:tyrosyl-tRNA synthetase